MVFCLKQGSVMNNVFLKQGSVMNKFCPKHGEGFKAPFLFFFISYNAFNVYIYFQYYFHVVSARRY